jgi:hypothetical protein
MFMHNIVFAITMLTQPIALEKPERKYPPFSLTDVGFDEYCAPNDKFWRLISVFGSGGRGRTEDEDKEINIDTPVYNAVSGDAKSELLFDEPTLWNGLKFTGIRTHTGIERGPSNYTMLFENDAETVRSTWNKLGWKLSAVGESREIDELEGYAFIGVNVDGKGASVTCFRD